MSFKSCAINHLNRPISLATSAGTGGNSPTHCGAFAWSDTGTTNNSDFSGSASIIIQVLPAITNLRIAPSSSSPESFSERTKASSTLPMLLLVTLSRTRYDCLSGIIDKCLDTQSRVLPDTENQPVSYLFGNVNFISLILLSISSSGVLKSGLSSGKIIPLFSGNNWDSSYIDLGHLYHGTSLGSVTNLTNQLSAITAKISMVSALFHPSNCGPFAIISVASSIVIALKL